MLNQLDKKPHRYSDATFCVPIPSLRFGLKTLLYFFNRSLCDCTTFLSVSLGGDRIDAYPELKQALDKREFLPFCFLR